LPTEIENLDAFLAEEAPTLQFQSGTRRVVSTVEQRPVGEERLRDSQRPTVRVLAPPGLAKGLDAPPRIDHVDLARSEESLAEMLAMLAHSPEPAVEPSRPSSTVVPAPVDTQSSERTTFLPPRPEPLAVSAAEPPKSLRVCPAPLAREYAITDGDVDDTTPVQVLRYEKLLGPFDRAPYLSVSMDEVMLAKLDHREGFVLSLVDGASNIDAIVDACPMPTEGTLCILHSLYVRGILGLR
jgi:hypothetical protein